MSDRNKPKIHIDSCLLAFLAGTSLLVSLCTSVGAEPSAANPVGQVSFDTLSQWSGNTAGRTAVTLEKTHNIGGKFDLLGNGALLLEKTEPQKPFWKADHFQKQGRWTSKWIESPGDGAVEALEADLIIYGQKQDMSKGWVKFSGNPLICEHGWKHATAQTLQLPARWSDRPADQSLVRGRGRWEGKWLIVFNIGCWAAKGWGMAVADSLEPLKRGINPFKIGEPYPLCRGTWGKNAPNDWIEIGGLWYAPDESKVGGPHLWTSTDLLKWNNRGPIRGNDGHDPGICYDGERFYLFNEYESGLKYCSAKDPLGEWTPHGVAFDIGSHCGDADVSFFNNRWHMTYDDNPHNHYKIGYASTSPSQFPKGWKLKRKIFGPHNPEQGQVWDDDTKDGNAFGAGDADLALEGTTLYMTYETPIGIAYKELEVLDGGEQTVAVKLELDRDGDGKADRATAWKTLKTGHNRWDRASGLPSVEGGRARIVFRLETRNRDESPMITRCALIARSQDSSGKR